MDDAAGNISRNFPGMAACCYCLAAYTSKLGFCFGGLPEHACFPLAVYWCSGLLVLYSFMAHIMAHIELMLSMRSYFSGFLAIGDCASFPCKSPWLIFS